MGILNLDFNLNLRPKKPIACSYIEYCQRSQYPKPFPKQVEMADWAFDHKAEPRLILGARGYGKTDYVTINGSGFKLLNDKQYKILLITKENERGKEIVAEIREGLEQNGVKFANRAKKKIRIVGCRGKEDNFTALTIRSKGIRGRHPNLIIMEDPITPEDTSETERRRVKNWVFGMVKSPNWTKTLMLNVPPVFPKRQFRRHISVLSQTIIRCRSADVKSLIITTGRMSCSLTRHIRGAI